jgi:hypothetical protein
MTGFADTHKNMRELTNDERVRFQMVSATARDLLAGALDDDEAFGAALAAFRQVGAGIDVNAQLNALHVPEDAGEYEDALRRILARIPDGWGRWISCDRGWYPILAELDRELTALDPLYEVQQVKEKFATLRYYYTSASERDYYRYSHPFTPEAAEQWEDEFEAFYESEDGQRLGKELEERAEKMEALVEAAEIKAAKTCELCGSAGRMYMTLGASPWHKTLCAECARSKKMVDEDAWNAWWRLEEPLHKAREREREDERHREFIAKNTGKRVIMVGGVRELAVPAYRPADVNEARAAASEDWDTVFLADDEIADAFIEGLAARYAQELADNAVAKDKHYEETTGMQRVMFRPKPPSTLKTVTVVGNSNKLKNSSVLFELGLSVHGSMPYMFADYKA